MGASECKQNGKWCVCGGVPIGHLLCVCWLAFLPSKPWMMKWLGPSFLSSIKWPKVLVNKLWVRKTGKRMLWPGILVSQYHSVGNVTYLVYILLDMLAKVQWKGPLGWSISKHTMRYSPAHTGGTQPKRSLSQHCRSLHQTFHTLYGRKLKGALKQQRQTKHRISFCFVADVHKPLLHLKESSNKCFVVHFIIVNHSFKISHGLLTAKIRTVKASIFSIVICAWKTGYREKQE